MALYFGNKILLKPCFVKIYSPFKKAGHYVYMHTGGHINENIFNMKSHLVQPVIKGVRYFLAHTPGLVRYGSKPNRELLKNPELLSDVISHLRSYPEAAAYAPNQVFLGALYPDELGAIAQPWYQANGKWQSSYPHGEIMPEELLYGPLKIADGFDLVWLEAGFAGEALEALADHRLVAEAELDNLRGGQPLLTIESEVADGKALPLYLRDGRSIGCIHRAHEEDAALAADVLLENLVCKVTAAMALRTLLRDEQVDPAEVDYILNSGEEAVGERYQRGGGNLAKPIPGAMPFGRTMSIQAMIMGGRPL